MESLKEYSGLTELVNRDNLSGFKAVLIPN